MTKFSSVLYYCPTILTRKREKKCIALVGITLVALIRHLHLNNKPEEKRKKANFKYRPALIKLRRQQISVNAFYKKYNHAVKT